MDQGEGVEKKHEKEGEEGVEVEKGNVEKRKEKKRKEEKNKRKE